MTRILSLGCISFTLIAHVIYGFYFMWPFVFLSCSCCSCNALNCFFMQFSFHWCLSVWWAVVTISQIKPPFDQQYFEWYWSNAIHWQDKRKRLAKLLLTICCFAITSQNGVWNQCNVQSVKNVCFFWWFVRSTEIHTCATKTLSFYALYVLTLHFEVGLSVCDQRTHHVYGEVTIPNASFTSWKLKISAGFLGFLCVKFKKVIPSSV